MSHYIIGYRKLKPQLDFTPYEIHCTKSLTRSPADQNESYNKVYKKNVICGRISTINSAKSFNHVRFIIYHKNVFF